MALSTLDATIMGNIQKANPTIKGSQMSASVLIFFWGKKKCFSGKKTNSTSFLLLEVRMGLKMPGASALRALSIFSFF